MNAGAKPRRRGGRAPPSAHPLHCQSGNARSRQATPERSENASGSALPRPRRVVARLRVHRDPPRRLAARSVLVQDQPPAALLAALTLFDHGPTGRRVVDGAAFLASESDHRCTPLSRPSERARASARSIRRPCLRCKGAAPALDTPTAGHHAERADRLVNCPSNRSRRVATSLATDRSGSASTAFALIGFPHGRV